MAEKKSTAQKKEVRKKKGNYVHDKQKMILAIKKKKGNKSAIARALNCDRKTLAKYIKEDPEIAAAFTESLDNRLDLAEEELDKLAFGKNTDPKIKLRALEFILTKMGRSRGYGTEPPKPVAPTKHVHTLVVKKREPEGES